MRYGVADIRHACFDGMDDTLSALIRDHDFAADRGEVFDVGTWVVRRRENIARLRADAGVPPYDPTGRLG